LVEQLAPHSHVVDIGANVGDSLASMINANSRINFICIEPDDIYFDFLKRNTDLMISHFDSCSISLSKALIGDGVDRVALERGWGTGRSVPGGNLPTVTLDSIICHHDVCNLRLIKSDVDGFDWKVLRSGEKCLQSGPMLFFECQFDNMDQFSEYLSVFTWLFDVGYTGFFFFDNFGDFVLDVRDVAGCHKLCEYLARQTFEVRGARTIYYFDVLAVFQDDIAFANASVERFTRSDFF
jgi:FkbM family methyltransferase